MSAMFLQACAPEVSRLVVHGDSTAIASRIPLIEKVWNIAPRLDKSRWFNIISSRSGMRVYNDGEPGQSMVSMRDRLAKDVAHRQVTTIFYDRRNTGERPEDYVKTLAGAISLLSTDKFLIVPQVPDPKDRTSEEYFAMCRIDKLVSQRWPANTFNEVERRAFVTALDEPRTRIDGLHRNALGQKIEAEAIGRWLAHKRWLDSGGESDVRS
ncbi:hypothetical protein [Caulobacter sp. LARHSG274]